ncbi:glutamate 5-kinase [Brachybacterium huguangmaarense]|uniref:Glutamate 5-kinase n=1 Tax=Brachybacterium huguangmaarense TaxID=1652028 RepID=A0ABY6FZ16_9MICO|nr:glutamate 5-kinase [Brachybacterium huguangmaarense]UYG16112.1 glutamate 5-kinase [Brachybacterium huguangmaarense]
MATAVEGPRQPQRLTAREQVAAARRIVVKIGSSSLTDADGHLDAASVAHVADQAARLVERGCEVVLVSSGAIAASLGPLGLPARPSDVPTQQAAAAVGQSLLAAAWSTSFGAHGLVTGQVLLAESDVIRSETYRNVRTALEALLAMGAVPVINENDTTATHEIRFGDNDRLAALVAQLLGADLLVLLTDVDALYTAPPSTPGAHRIPVVEDPAALEGVSVGSVGSSVGTGGMVTKLAAAQHATITGTATLLAAAGHFADVVAGADVGTFFPAHHGRRRSRLVWLRFATRGAGSLLIDEGAAAALTASRRSLLPVGVTGIEGTFPAGVPVDVRAPDGTVVARGLAAYGSEDLRSMVGRATGELRRERGDRYGRPVIHRDDMVLLPRP